MADPETSAPPPLDPRAGACCPRCALGVPAGFAFCPRCRALAEGREYDPGEVDRHERAYVFSLVALSLGALGVPRLLRSRSFSAAEKAALALLGLLNTGGVVVVLVVFARWFPAYLEGLLHRG